MAIYVKNNRQYIDYYVSGRRKRECLGLCSRSVAEKILKKRLVEIAEGKYLDKRKLSNTTFDTFAQEFLKIHSKPHKKSWKTDQYHLLFFSKHFGTRPISSISTHDVEQFKALRLKTVKPSTINRELCTLKVLFSKAVEWGKISQNPLNKVKLFKIPPGRTRFLEKEEIATLLNNCLSHLKPIVILALNTGMRKGEILNLKWYDIDINKRVLIVRETKNNELKFVPLNQTTLSTLVAIKKNPNSPYVFCSKDGKKYGDIKKSFVSAVKASGIKDFTFHDLRHTFASHLVMAGVDIKTVMELLGHKDIRMTNRYAHLSGDFKQKAVDLLGKTIDTRIDTLTNPKDGSQNIVIQRSENQIVTQSGQ